MPISRTWPRVLLTACLLVACARARTNEASPDLAPSASTTTGMEASAPSSAPPSTEKTVDGSASPIRPPSRMDGPYASLEIACDRLSKTCTAQAGAKCACFRAKPSGGSPLGAALDVDVLGVVAPESAAHLQWSVPAIRMSKGWWIELDPPVDAGLEGGMQTVCHGDLARPRIETSSGAGREVIFFRVEVDWTCVSRFDARPPSKELGAMALDVACTLSSASAPTCVNAARVYAPLPPIASSFPPDAGG